MRGFLFFDENTGRWAIIFLNSYATIMQVRICFFPVPRGGSNRFLIISSLVLEMKTERFSKRWLMAFSYLYFYLLSRCEIFRKKIFCQKPLFDWSFWVKAEFLRFFFILYMVYNICYIMYDIWYYILLIVP